MSKFMVRTLSGIVLMLILCSAFIVGDYYLWLLFGFISVVGIGELFKATGTEDGKKLLKYIAIIGCIAYYLVIKFVGADRLDCMFFVIIITLLALMAACVLAYPRYSFFDISKSLFALVYVGVMLSFVYLTRASELGIYMVWLIVISSWGCDTCAYLVGSAIGKHRLAPVLSPKKSVEGAIGGSLGSGLIAAIYGYVLYKMNFLAMEYIWLLGIICIAASIASQVGDLMASAIKREFGVKDYGTLIPGHGGIMDRFDSMIVTAPIIYFLGAFLK